MPSPQDLESRRRVSPKALLFGLVVGCLVFTLSVFATGIGANLLDYSDPSATEETDRAPSATSTAQNQDGVVQAKVSSTVADAGKAETTAQHKQDPGPKAYAVASAVKR